MSSNGRLRASELAAIPFGMLARAAAAAWNAGPAKHGLKPVGPRASYRTFLWQVYFWNLYISGRGNLAARPGTSNHGWGEAVDLFARWMRAWIDRYGALYGWRKIEAPGEWWHVNYVGGFVQRRVNPLAGLKGKDLRAAQGLLYRRREMAREKPTGMGRRFKRHLRIARRWIKRIERRRADLADRGHKDSKTYVVLGRVLNAHNGRL